MPTFHLEIVTPEAVILSDQVKYVRAPGIQGSFGVLAGHAPLMTALSVGLLKVEHANGDLEYIATSGGFIEVQRDKVIILADTAERASEIDVTRCEDAIERARKLLASGEAIDYDAVHQALERATNRLKIAKMVREQ